MNIAETFYKTTTHIDANGFGVIPAVICVVVVLGFLLFKVGKSSV